MNRLDKQEMNSLDVSGVKVNERNNGRYLGTCDSICNTV